jgi:hypothetical protein
MAEEPSKTGTPSPEDGDAGESTQKTGTQDKDGRDGQAQSDTEKLNLTWKEKAERVNQLEAKLAELEERLKQSPAASERNERGTQDDDDWDRVADFAAKGDPVARAQLRLRQALVEHAVTTTHESQIMEMPEAERREVREHFQKNRHRLGDPQAARSELRERKLSAENEKLRAELEKASQRPDTDVVRTHHREVPASEHKVRTMSPEEFDAEQARLAAEGRHRDKMAMQRDYAEGKIELKR